MTGQIGRTSESARTGRAGSPAWAVVAAFACVFALACVAPAPAMAQEAAGPDVAGALEVTISPGKSQVLELPETYTDVMIGDPKIADVLPLNARSVYIVGKTMGSTGLTIYGPNKRLIAAVNVVVAVDIQGLKARLAEFCPMKRTSPFAPRTSRSWCRARSAARSRSNR